jgi:hypothetical protein
MDEAVLSAATKRRLKSLEKELEACAARIGKERDKMELLIDNVRDIMDSVDGFQMQLEDALQTLSGVV